MSRTPAYLLTLTLLVLAACTPSARPTPEPAAPTLALAIPAASTPVGTPTVAAPTPDWSRLLSEQLASSDPSQADQTVQELTTWARDASGLRAALGPQADEIFRMADQVETAVSQDILRQLQPGSKPKGMPAPLPPRSRGFIGPDQAQGLTTLFTILASAPRMLGSAQEGNTNPITSTNEFNQAGAENSRAHAKTTSTIAGSQIQVQVEMTIRVEKDGIVYEEQATGKISLNVCPDAQGNVPLDLTMQSQAGAGGGGYSQQFTDHAIGHVDDEANLTSVDHEFQSELSFTKGKNWFTGAPDTTFAQVNGRFTVGGLTSKSSKSWSITGVQARVPRSSFFVSQEIVEETAKSGMGFAVLAQTAVFADAQDKWQNGYCVAVVAPEGEERRVMKGSETPFTATVRHKFEGKELAVPVLATLKSGQVSVIPSGTKVPAPATFRYKAPDQAGGEGATVQLVTRSRRGIGKLGILFRTAELFYTVDTSWGGSAIQLTGTICAFDKPFTLKLGGNKPGAGPYTGKIEFKPKDATSGSWMAMGTYTVPYAGPTHDSGGSTYQVTGLTDGKPVIILNEFTQTGVLTSPPFRTTYHWPAMQIPLIPETGACSSD